MLTSQFVRPKLCGSIIAENGVVKSRMTLLWSFGGL